MGYRTALAGKRHIQPPEAFPFEQVGAAQTGLDWEARVLEREMARGFGSDESADEAEKAERAAT